MIKKEITMVNGSDDKLCCDAEYSKYICTELIISSIFII